MCYIYFYMNIFGTVSGVGANVVLCGVHLPTCDGSLVVCRLGNRHFTTGLLDQQARSVVDIFEHAYGRMMDWMVCQDGRTQSRIHTTHNYTQSHTSTHVDSAHTIPHIHTHSHTNTHAPCTVGMKALNPYLHTRP